MQIVIVLFCVYSLGLYLTKSGFSLCVCVCNNILAELGVSGYISAKVGSLFGNIWVYADTVFLSM